MPHIEERKYEHELVGGRIVSRQRVYQLQNRDKFNDYRKSWREDNRERIAEYNKTWRKNKKLAAKVELTDAETF